MSNPKIFFHSNIRFLRERKRYSQEEFAGMFGITRNKLQALESGKTVNPVATDLVNFSEYFKLSIDTLFKIDLSKLSELVLRELEAGNDPYVTGSKLRVLAITTDKGGKENVEYVPMKAKSGYVAGFNDPEFIKNLPKLQMPQLPDNKTFRMFPITGDSMLPIKTGDYVIAEYVEDWWSIKVKSLCIVVLKQQQDIVLKAVTPLRMKNTFLFESYNKIYQPYEVFVNDILEIWTFKSIISSQTPEPVEDIYEIGLKIKEIYDQVIKKKVG